MNGPTPITPPTLETSHVLPLLGLVEIAPQAIVSRTLMRTGGGSVTAFAFDEGQELAEHTAPFDAMVVVVDGRLEIRIGGEPHLVSSGETIVMPAGVPHALMAGKATRMLLVMLRSNPAGS